MPPSDPSEDARHVMSSDKAAVSRALNLVEDRRLESHARVAALLAALKDAPKAAGGHRVGLTGPPGVGKSTLTSALARSVRRRGRTVGVVAVDPSSIRSGGSLLGDRARMSFDPTDAGLFVRSLATAGEVGGLAYAANSAVRVLAAAYDMVVVETTGVGQSEVDVVDVADTVVLVIQPGSGDVLQFLKAGIMEIPDILVVNKADQEELARRAVADLRGRDSNRPGCRGRGRTGRRLADPDRCHQRDPGHRNRRADRLRSNSIGRTSNRPSRRGVGRGRCAGSWTFSAVNMASTAFRP